MVGRALACMVAFAAALAVFTAPALASFGLAENSFENTILGEDGSPVVQAGSHPFAMTTSFKFITKERSSGGPVPDEDVKDIEVQLPPGLAGNPTAAAQCTIEELNSQNHHRSLAQGLCPDDSQVGVARVEITPSKQGEPVPLTVGVYNIVAPPGVPAELGLDPAGIPIILFPKVRTGSDYGVTVVSRNNLQAQRLFGVKTTIWGVPSAPSHDGERGECLGETGETFLNGNTCPVGVRGKPFLTMPSKCQTGGLATRIYADSWQNPAPGVELTGFEPPTIVTAEAVNHDSEGQAAGVSGCEHLDFSPTVSVTPTAKAAGSPTGLSVGVTLPQSENPDGLAEADLKAATVSLPAGMSISPSAANGLQACTDTPEPASEEEPARPGGEIELHSTRPVKCPDASKVGSVEIETPLLATPLKGSVYIAAQEQNPFGSPFALYLVAKGSGVDVKLAGEVHADPNTGQLSTTFAGNPPFEGTPQQPFSHLTVSLFSGPHAALMTPKQCGSYATTGVLTPWSGGLPVAFSDAFTVTSACGGAFSPSLTAGTLSNQAGGFSPFALSLTRSDQEQGFKQLTVRTPPGLAGMLSKIQLCQEPQAAQGTCPEASRIGHVIVGAGPGPEPVYVPQPGKPQDPVYLTGPYKGAPFGLSVVVPAEAGPFNLGELDPTTGAHKPVIVRSAINVDPRDAQITITSDPLPTILDGVPLDIKSINVIVDREGFIFNPTNCEPSSVNASILSDQGASSLPTSPFQVANCAALAFKPSFKVTTQAKTSKANGASLDVKVTYPKGSEANIAAVKVTLPKQLPSRLTTIQKACTATQFDSNPAGCPPGSLVGTATALTPVLAHPLTGPAYLVSHGGAAFPDLVIVLQGEGITLNLTGNTDIKKGITHSTFASIPDEPISSFDLKLPTGPHSALTANTPTGPNGTLCKTKLTMPTTLIAQNNTQIKQNTKITTTGCPKTKKTNKRHGQHTATKAGHKHKQGK